MPYLPTAGAAALEEIKARLERDGWLTEDDYGDNKVPLRMRLMDVRAEGAPGLPEVDLTSIW